MNHEVTSTAVETFQFHLAFGARDLRLLIRRHAVISVAPAPR